MLLKKKKCVLTPEEYLTIESQADFRSEYFDGEMFAMAGASRRHNRIISNLVIRLGIQLEETPCNIYANDLKVKISKTGLYTYPDIVITCGDEIFDDKEQNVLLNPILIIEVLSDSTEAYDRGEKFLHYQHIESLMEYVLISQNKELVERYLRQNNGNWLYSRNENNYDTVKFDSVACSLILKKIYTKT